MGYVIDPAAGIGSRIGDMTLLATGEAIEPAREYAVAGWASVNEGTEGPPIWDVVEAYLARTRIVRPTPNSAIRVRG
jgi:sulfur-oxidizing protein SoxB